MIRIAKKEELQAVNEIRRQVNTLHCDGRPDIFRAGFCEELQEHLYEQWEREDADVIVAIREDKVCGFAMVDYITKPLSPYNRERRYYHIEEIGVDEKHRRQGVATELFTYMKEDAKNKGLNKIELDMWEFNESALQFYESVGFKTYRRYLEYDNE